MRTHNLTDESLYPNVHFYTMNRVVNIFTAEKIRIGDRFKKDGQWCEVVSVETDSVCGTLEDRYSYSTKYNVVKFRKVA